jgi:hypothetical protein
MAGNIFGTYNSSASLDGVVGSQPLAPSGNLINKASPTPLAAALTCSTWVNSGSNLIATCTVTNTLTNGDLVAIFWSGGYVTDALVSSATTSGFVATVSNLLLPGGSTAQTALPATNTPILISQVTQVTGLSIVGSNLQQLLVQSTQPGLVELFDNSAVIQRTSIITIPNGFDGWPTYAGQALPFTSDVIALNIYNNSTNTAVTNVVALLG